MKPRELTYLAGYGFRTLIFRQKKPIIAGMPLTDVCNLKCKHCVVANVGRGHYPFIKIEERLQYFYDLGVRIIYLQGGEIMTWQDGTKNINDVIRRAHEIGFFKVAVVTNGTLALPVSRPDVGQPRRLRGRHDSIRGAGVFAKVMESLKKTKHRRVSVNMTINHLNAGEVEKVAEIARSLPTVHGVSFNFHTPTRSRRTCPVNRERAGVIDRILSLKAPGLPGA